MFIECWAWDGITRACIVGERGTCLLQVRQASIQKPLLRRSNLPNIMNLLHTIRTQLHLTSKEIHSLVLIQRTIHKSGLNNTLLSLCSLQQALREPRACHRHRQCRGSSSILRGHYLITSELDAFEEILLAYEIGMRGLREQWYDGDARVAAYNNNILIYGIGPLQLRHKSTSSHDIQCRNTEQSLRVINACLLEDLCNDWHSAVDRVRNNEDVCIGSGFSGGFGEIADNGGVGVEEVVAGHTGFARDTSGNKHDFSAFECAGETAGCWVVAGDFGFGVDVANVCGDTCDSILVRNHDEVRETVV